MKLLVLFVLLSSLSTSFGQRDSSIVISENRVEWNDCFYKCTADTNKNSLHANYGLKDSIYFLTKAGKVLPNLRFPVLDKAQAKGYYQAGKWNSNHKAVQIKLPVPSQYFGTLSYSENLGDIFYIKGVFAKANTTEKMELFINDGNFASFKFTVIDEDGRDLWGLFGFNGSQFYLIKSAGVTAIEPRILSNPIEWMNKFRTVWMECYSSNVDCN